MTERCDVPMSKLLDPIFAFIGFFAARHDLTRKNNDFDIIDKDTLIVIETVRPHHKLKRHLEAINNNMTKLQLVRAHKHSAAPESRVASRKKSRVSNPKVADEVGQGCLVDDQLRDRQHILFFLFPENTAPCQASLPAYSAPNGM